MAVSILSAWARMVELRVLRPGGNLLKRGLPHLEHSLTFLRTIESEEAKEVDRSNYLIKEHF